MSNVILNINQKFANVALPQELICQESWCPARWKKAYRSLAHRVLTNRTIVSIVITRKGTMHWGNGGFSKNDRSGFEMEVTR